jgi:hypothetical protein
MKRRWGAHDGHEWTADGEKITSSSNLAAIEAALDDGPIVVERRFYLGSAAPERLIFEDFGEFSAWLRTTFAGDHIWVWSLHRVCLDDNAVAHGKSPDEAGLTPVGGAY